MKLTELSLNNYRGFKDIHLNFKGDNLAVIIGINGSGKTTILDSIATLLGDLVGFICNNNKAEKQMAQLVKKVSETDNEIMRARELLNYYRK